MKLCKERPKNYIHNLAKYKCKYYIQIIQRRIATIMHQLKNEILRESQEMRT